MPSSRNQLSLRRSTLSHDAPYRTVYGDVSKIIDAARESAARSVNAAMTAAYWLIGRRIIDFEQSGEERAKYGAALIESLAEDLTVRFGRGFSLQNIYNMRLFYLSYPPDRILQTPSGKLAALPRRQILQTPTGDFESPSAGVGLDDLLIAFPLPWWFTCGCFRSGTRTLANSTRPRCCEVGGRSTHLYLRLTGTRTPHRGSPCAGSGLAMPGYWVRLITIIAISSVQELKASSRATTVATRTLSLSSSNGFSSSVTTESLRHVVVPTQ